MTEEHPEEKDRKQIHFKSKDKKFNVEEIEFKLDSMEEHSKESQNGHASLREVLFLVDEVKKELAILNQRKYPRSKNTKTEKSLKEKEGVQSAKDRSETETIPNSSDSTEPGSHFLSSKIPQKPVSKQIKRNNDSNETERHILDSRIHNLSSQLHNRDLQIAQQEQEIEQLTSDLTEKNEALDTLETIVYQSKLRISELQDKIRYLEERLEIANNSLDPVIKPKETLKPETLFVPANQLLNSDLDPLGTRMTPVHVGPKKKESDPKLESENNQLSKQLELKTSRIQGLEHIIGDKDNQILELQDKNLFLENKLETIQVLLASKIKNKDNEISELKQKSKDLELLIYRFIEK